VRHGAECFNFWFPQELDKRFLVVWDGFHAYGSRVPWRYVDQQGLRDFLLGRVEDGYAFPLNPKWILCDEGWLPIFRAIQSSPHAADALSSWLPPSSGLMQRIDAIAAAHPNGFQPQGQQVHAAAHDRACFVLVDPPTSCFFTFICARRDRPDPRGCTASADREHRLRRGRVAAEAAPCAAARARQGDRRREPHYSHRHQPHRHQPHRTTTSPTIECAVVARYSHASSALAVRLSPSRASVRQLRAVFRFSQMSVQAQAKKHHAAADGGG
jgi:hypothetical protein